MGPRVLSYLVWLTLVFASSAPSNAQFGKYGNQFRNIVPAYWPLQGNTKGMLVRKDVVTELHLNQRQTAQITRILDAEIAQIRETIAAANESIADLPLLQRQDARDKLQFDINMWEAGFRGDIGKDIETVLTSEQNKRLRQLDLQYRGPLCLAGINPVVMLTSGDGIRERDAFHIQAEFQGNCRSAISKARGDENAVRLPASVRKQLAQIKAEAEAKILAMMKPEEKAKWTEAIGAPFKFTE